MDPDNDLPLLSNTHEIQVIHYFLDLTCDLDSSILTGSAVYFLDPCLEQGGCPGRVFGIHEFHGKYKDDTDTNKLTSDGMCSQCDHDVSPKDHRCTGKTNVCPELSNAVETSGSLKSENQNQNQYPVAHPSVADSQDSNLLEHSTCKSCNHDASGQPFAFVLDCCDLDIEKVEYASINLHTAEQLRLSNQLPLENKRDLYEKCRSHEWLDLDFSLEKWCVRIWKQGAASALDFPRVVKVTYATRSSGTSLRWTVDQDGNRCMYTSAMFVNNRSFFPCQEYGNLCTWQCQIWVENGNTVFMSGDSVEKAIASNSGSTQWYHECRMPLPSFTLAIAVGKWSTAVIKEQQELSPSPSSPCFHTPSCIINYSQETVLPCRVIAPASLLARTHTELVEYWPRVSAAVQELLGPHPFWRVDVILYPASSQDMAMANPNFVFLSQSLFAGDESMLVRLAHELTHSWFGLLIGARDWTEEWLSEGFATYMEDWVHGKAMGWSMKQQEDYGELRATLRYNVLSAELEHTQDSLQVLRQNQVPEKETESTVMFVKNGLNAGKLFTQVHYLKGYFMLRYLANIVGVIQFNEFLKAYVIRYHGRLVRSKDFLEMCCEAFPELSARGIAPSSINSRWLDHPGMPQALADYKPSESNMLYKVVVAKAEEWVQFEKSRARRHRNRKRPRVEPPTAAEQSVADEVPSSANCSCQFQPLQFASPGAVINTDQLYRNPQGLITSVAADATSDVDVVTSDGITLTTYEVSALLKHFKIIPDQLVLLLENILQIPKISNSALTQLSSSYDLPKQNADVRHRWCELVIKHRYCPGYEDVKKFLIHDQAMGVYLYGELMISRCGKQRDLARECFKETEKLMEPSTRKLVHTMLYGE